jgi:RimJ/RimL family protein N-acetyltransferase
MDLPAEDGPRQQNLTGPEFDLIPLYDVQAADIVAGLAEFDVARWLSRVPFPYGLDDARAYQEGFGGADSSIRAIVVEGQFAGIIGIKPDLGYWLAKPFWGRGLATAAAQRLLADHFFNAQEPIISGHFAGNAASAKVLAKLGFVYTHQETVIPLSTDIETVVERMSLDRGDWWAAQGLPVRTARLCLRPMTVRDAPDFHALVTRPEVARMLFIFAVDWPEAAAAPFLYDVRWQGRPGFRFAIELRGVWVGWIGCSEDAEPEVFYALRPEFAGKGIAQEALGAFASFLFDRFGLIALHAGVFTDNPASARVLAACGFERVGETIGASKGRVAPAPEWRFRLDRAVLPL